MIDFSLIKIYNYKFSVLRIAAFITLLLYVNIVHGQTIKSLQILPGNSVGQKEGLLQLNVKGLTQDKQGFIWAGTEDGLFRFNGYEFKPYLHNPKDSSTIKDDHIRDLLFINDSLWIATNSGGILGFIPSEDSFFYPTISAENTEFMVGYKVLQFGGNHVFFSVKNNLLIYNRESKKSRQISLPESIKESYVTDVLKINDNKFWLATTASGILEFDRSFDFKQIDLLSDRSIQCLYKIDSIIYIGTDEGLYIYNGVSSKLEKSTLAYSIKSIYKINKKQFYIGTDNGLFLYDIDSFSVTPIGLKTGENRIYEKLDINKIIGDEKGNLWIGTDGDGLFFYNTFQTKFETLKLRLKEYPLVSNISTFQMLKGNDSTLWIGSKYGIVKYYFENKQFKLYNANDQFLAYTMVKDENNTIWAGGFTSGLLKYDSKTDSFKKILATNSSLPDEDIVEIIPIDKNTLWICTWSGGIHKFDINTKQFVEIKIRGERLNRARTSLKDSNGNIWLGTDQGAYKISKSSEVNWYNSLANSEQKLSSDRVFSIKEDNDGNIWFGSNVGLTRLNVKTEKTTLFYQQKGLPNDFVYSILIDENNNIWLSTNFGISVLNTQTNTFKNYTTSDGLQNNEFNGKAGYKDVYGNFYFGGMSGINIFKPEKIQENPYLPKVYIESVELFNRPLNKNELFKDTLYFKSNENVLTFNYAALNFLNPEKCSYTYKMEGFDEDWRPITFNRSTTYTNLNPGEYTFKVKASNDAGQWNENADAMLIVIVPPWYLTTGFKISFIILFLLSGVIFYFYQTTKLKKDKLKLEQVIVERTQDVRNTNTKLKQAINEVEQQHNNIQFLMKELKHRVKNNLQVLSSLLNIQANSLENKSAIDALKLAKNRILAISHIENIISNEDESIQLDVFIKVLSNNIFSALSDDESLKYKMVFDVPEMQIKNVNSTMLGLILNELITNTTKYAFDKYEPANILKISCEVDRGHLVLVICDNGKGYSQYNDRPQKSMGIGLVNEMVSQLYGTIITNSNNGTENIIKIPI